VHSLELFLDQAHHADVAARLDIPGRLRRAQAELASVRSTAFRASLVGTIGAERA
jgi:hypothetical protein